MRSEKPNKILYIVLSLLLAVAFWLFVDTEEDNTISQTFSGLQVEFIGAEDTLPSRGLMLTDGMDATVDLRLSGPRTILSSLRRSDLKLQVNLTDITAAGTYSKNYTLLTPDTVDRTSIKTESQSRSTITVQIEPLSTKTIPVQLKPVGEVAEGHICMNDMRVVEPSTITISGRDEDIDPVESALVEVDLTGAETTINQEFSYQLLDGEENPVENESIRLSERRVLVTVPVYVTKELDLVVNFVESPGSKLGNVDWDLDVKSITVAGEPASLEGKDNIVLADIDLSAYPMDTELPLEISLPAGCVNVSGDTTANLTLKFRGLTTKVFTVTNISATGLGEGQKFSLITNSVEVQLRGSVADLELVTPEDIRIVVDVSQYTTNTTSSEPAKVLVDGFSNVGAVGAYNVFFKISFQ